LNSLKPCRLGLSFGQESSLYSFPEGHPLNSTRTELFSNSLSKLSLEKEHISILKPTSSNEDDLLLFHSNEYVNFVKESSKIGKGYLDYGDTPSFKGVYEASLIPVGCSLNGYESVISKKYDHFFNPVGGLHHARRDRAGGFCVFNDAAIVISKSLNHFSKIAYVDIDAHHGDGIYYGFESDPRVIIGDIHEDGRFLYPGTGLANETGKGKAKGTKMNVPLPPGSRDSEFIEAFEKIVQFIRGFSPEFIFFQCGADGLEGDPITHLKYSSRAHAYAARKLHSLAHEHCEGRILAMGGGGYDPQNVSSAWIAVASELASS
jgi:acetoin utilization protein AcuC